MAEQQISVAVIGAGHGRPQPRRRATGRSTRSSAPGCRRSGWPPSPTRTSRWPRTRARRYGFEKAVYSWEDVAEDPSIDAVSIVVGNALHRPIAEALVAAGKHVLCEKPLAGSMDDARAMVELEESADVVTAVGYTFRRSPAIAAIRDHVQDGELGDLTLFSGRYWCDYACDPRGPLSWRFKGGPGSGALGRHRGARDRRRRVRLRADRLGLRRHAGDPDRQAPAAAGCGRRAQRRAGQRRAGRGGERGHRHLHRPLRVRAGRHVLRSRAPPSACPTGSASTSTGSPAAPPIDQHRPAEYRFDDAQPEARTRGVRQIIAGPQLPYFAGGYPMEAPGVGGGNAENFTYQARAFLDQVSGAPEPLPACATFADALHTMEIIQAVARSAQDRWRRRRRPLIRPSPRPRSTRWPSSSAPTPPVCTTAPSPRRWTCLSPTG